MNRHTIGILAHFGQQGFGMQTTFFEEMLPIFKQLQLNAFFIDVNNWKPYEDSVCGHFFDAERGLWAVETQPLPTVFYNRFWTKNPTEAELFKRFRTHLEVSKRLIFNPYELSVLSNDKLRSHAFLEQNRLPTLAAWALEDFLQTTDLLAASNRFYLKPIRGGQGKGIFVFERIKKNFFRLFEVKKEIWNGNQIDLFEQLQRQLPPSNYLVQPAALSSRLDDAPFDIRVLVQNNAHGDYGITGKSGRLGQVASWVSNLHQGGKAVPFDVLAERVKQNSGQNIALWEDKIHEICIAAARKLHQTVGEFIELGFDILIDDLQGPVILEINSKPSRWVFKKISEEKKYNLQIKNHFSSIRYASICLPLVFLNQKIKTF